MSSIKLGSHSDDRGLLLNPNLIIYNGNKVYKVVSNNTTIWDASANALVPSLSYDWGNSDMGLAFSSGAFDENYLAYNAFNNGNARWCSTSIQANTNYYLGYKFKNPVCVRRVYLKNFWDNYHVQSFQLQGSNDGNSWTTIGTYNHSNTNSYAAFYNIENRAYYLQYRLLLQGRTGGYYEIQSLQFYGSKIEGIIPRMTSNTSPYGEVTCSSCWDSSYDGYRAFSDTPDRGWAPAINTTSGWLKYKFNYPRSINGVCFVNQSGGNTTFTLQGSNDDITYKDILTITAKSGYDRTYKTCNTVKYLYYKFTSTATNYGGNGYLFQLFKEI